MSATLRGPADPDKFRVQVGRYGDRFYIDTLPACEIAGPMTDPVPSVSAVKSAYPKFLTKWAADTTARWAVENVETWRALDREAAFDLVRGATNRHRDKAANRGTQIHRLIEDVAEGRSPDVAALTDDVTPWVPAVRQLIDDLRPAFALSEFVVIDQARRYGGTGDAVIEVDVPGLSGRFLVDWKTREAGKPRVYTDEAAQIGAYACAEYVIVETDGVAQRVRMPDLDGGLIITIAPDGYTLHPIDLQAACDAWDTLRAFYDVTKAKLVGSPVRVGRGDPARTPQEPTTDREQVEWLKGRVAALIEAGHGEVIARRWPVDVPTFKAGGPRTDEEFAALTVAVVRAEAEVGQPFPEPSPEQETRWAAEAAEKAHARAERSEAARAANVVAMPADPAECEALIERARELPADLIAELQQTTVDANRVPNLRSGQATVAHLAIVREHLDRIEAVHRERRSRVAAMIGTLEAAGVPMETALAAVGWTSDVEPAKMCQLDVERLDDLCDAVTDGLVVIDDGRLVPAPDAETRIRSIHGDGRKILAAARRLADQRGLDRPQSTKDALADPVLVAALAMAS